MKNFKHKTINIKRACENTVWFLKFKWLAPLSCSRKTLKDGFYSVLVFCIIAASYIPQACKFWLPRHRRAQSLTFGHFYIALSSGNCSSLTIKETFKDQSSIIHAHRYTLFYTNALLKMLPGWPVTKLYPCRVKKKIKTKSYLLQCINMFSVIPAVWSVPRCEQLNLLSMYAAAYPVWDIALRKCGTRFKFGLKKTSYIFWNFVYGYCRL